MIRCSNSKRSKTTGFPLSGLCLNYFSVMSFSFTFKSSLSDFIFVFKLIFTNKMPFTERCKLLPSLLTY